MLGKIFGIMSLAALAFGAAFGRLDAVGTAVFEGADSALKLTLSLCGAMCLWGGIMQLLRAAGIIGVFARLLSPLISLFFPDVKRDGRGREEITACIAANLLGIGNAATPLALSAMKKLYESALERGDPEGVASRDMITLAVLNTASANLLPTTVIALRRAAGSSRPFAIVMPIWICSFSCAALALLICRGMGIRENTRHGAS